MVGRRLGASAEGHEFFVVGAVMPFGLLQHVSDKRRVHPGQVVLDAICPSRHARAERLLDGGGGQ
ncbi:MAG: hypothetical protein HIU92_21545 [Proteobacteria bacterium]|nr:hypothetical protein [Pseudomonadota bacterium]